MPGKLALMQPIVFFFEVKKVRKIVLRNGGFVKSAATDQFGVAVTLAALKRQLAGFECRSGHRLS